MSISISNRLVSFTAAAAAIGFLVHGVAVPAIAQIRAALTKDVDHPIRQPFNVTSLIDISPGGGTEYRTTALTVPAGKRAVLEHLACAGGAPVDTKVAYFAALYNVSPNPGRTSFLYAAPILTAADPVFNRFVGSQSFRAYSDPGSEVRFVVKLANATMGFGSFDCSLSGHYVDLAY